MSRETPTWDITSKQVPNAGWNTIFEIDINPLEMTAF